MCDAGQYSIPVTWPSQPLDGTVNAWDFDADRDCRPSTVLKRRSAGEGNGDLAAVSHSD